MRYGPPSQLPTSNSVTMFGWLSCAAASASRWSQASRSRAGCSPGDIAFSATSRPSCRSRASNTIPNPPRPSSRTSSNRPTARPGRRLRAHASDASYSGVRASACRSSVSAPGLTASLPSSSEGGATPREKARRSVPIESRASGPSTAGRSGASGTPSSAEPFLESRSV